MLHYIHQNKKFNQVYYNVMTKKFNFEVNIIQSNDKDLIPQSGGEEFKLSHTYNIGHLGHLGFYIV
jgi:hypothetical protein